MAVGPALIIMMMGFWFPVPFEVLLILATFNASVNFIIFRYSYSASGVIEEQQREFANFNVVMNECADDFNALTKRAEEGIADVLNFREEISGMVADMSPLTTVLREHRDPLLHGIEKLRSVPWDKIEQGAELFESLDLKEMIDRLQELADNFGLIKRTQDFDLDGLTAKVGEWIPIEEDEISIPIPPPVPSSIG